MAQSNEFSMEALDARPRVVEGQLPSWPRPDFRRADGNHRAGILADSDFEKARATLLSAQAAVEGAQRRADQARATLDASQDTLAKTTIHAPIDGIVTSRPVEEGEVAVIGIQEQSGHRAADHLRACARPWRPRWRTD